MAFPYPYHLGKQSNGYWHFDSALDFYETAMKAPLSNPEWGRDRSGGRSSRSNGRRGGGEGKEWYGTNTFEEAVDLATHGWKEGVQKARPIAEQMSDELVATLARPKVVYDVEGEMFDMGKVIEDEPECWMHWQEGSDTSEMEESAKGPIKLVLNCTVSSGISTKIIENRGCAIMALATVFHAAQRPTRIEIVAPISDRNVKEVSVVLKDYYDDPQDDALAFALIHPSFFRRMVFSLWEVMDIYDTRGYGTPTDTCRDKGDIYIGQATWGHSEWSTEASAMAWVKEQLKNQGVKFLK